MSIHSVLLMAAMLAGAAHAQERTNHFGDPFLQVTQALPGCPEPRPPGFTPEEVRQEAHVRSQHGGSCHRAGRCRLPNSYLYDQEIIPRVAQSLRQDGRFDASSVWVLGERRLVTLLGCAASRDQAADMEKVVLLVDDVMGVINLLRVGDEPVRYPVARP